MMALPLLTQRMVIFGVAALLVLGSILFSWPSPLNAFKLDKYGAISTYPPVKAPPPAQVPNYGFGDLMYELYKPIKVPVLARSYTDQHGKKFDNGGHEHWTQPLGRDVLVIDLDTREPNGSNEVFNAAKMDWEKVEASGSGLLTVSHVNHYIYSQIHGYDYKFYHAQDMSGHWNSWIKPHVLQAVLPSYKFVVFIDADAIVQHLEVPMEFLFSRWNISPNTSIAMPIDTRQILANSNTISADSKGKTVLNSGVVVLQNLPHTFEMLKAWTECTSEKRYPGCGKWKKTWSHEQRAFSEFIRYDFNPAGNNIVEIPCNDANGFPGLKGQANVVDDCRGEFVRHHTLDKGRAKTSTGDAIMQTMGELLQKNFAANRESMLIEEGSMLRYE